jgi:8-oxo-dGTP diphosphatase
LRRIANADTLDSAEGFVEFVRLTDQPGSATIKCGPVLIGRLSLVSRMIWSMRLYSVVVLFYGGRLLLLQRAATKAFAPRRWTGLGGRVEANELDDLEAAARRELFEETDLRPTEVSPLRLRRTLTMDRPTEGLICLLYFTGETASPRLPASNDGSLRWVEPVEVATLDVIENTATVLPLLVEDARRDSSGIRCGVASYAPGGRLIRAQFADESG